MTSSGNSSTPIQPVNPPTLQYSPIVVTLSSNSSQGSTAAQIFPLVAVTTIRVNPVAAGITLGVGALYVSYLVWNNLSYAQGQPYFNSPDNTVVYRPPFILQSKDKGDKLKGGKQNQRDADIKRYPPDFQRWYHREYKPRVNPGRNATPEELQEAFDDWVLEGKPKTK